MTAMTSLGVAATPAGIWHLPRLCGLAVCGLREAATLLIRELPSSESSHYPSARLAEAVAKGQGRDYWISRQALAAIRTYRNWSRAEAVRRAQEQGPLRPMCRES